MPSRNTAALAGLLAITVAFAFSQSEASGGPTTVGMFFDGPWYKNEEIESLFRREIDALVGGEFEVRFPEEKKIEGDWTVAGAREAFRSLLEDDDVDLVLAMGGLASNLAVETGPLPKPVIAPFVIEGFLDRMPVSGGGSGVPNLAYLVIPSHIVRDLKMFREIIPIDRPALLLHGAFVDAYPEIVGHLAAKLAAEGLPPVAMVPVRESAAEALAAIPADADGVYMTFLMMLGEAEFDRLIEGLVERRLPSFSMVGMADVERGVLAGMQTTGIFDRRARRTALTLQRILLGEAPETIPVSFTGESRLTINMGTARAIGVSPDWIVLNEAILLNESREDVERRVDLAGVIREAVRVNLDIEAERLALSAGREDVADARAALLPTIEGSVSGAFIDEDRAAASFGQNAERRYSGSLALRQVLFSEALWANRSVQGHLQRGRERDMEALRLDIARDAAAAYLDVLIASTLEDIEKANLEVTRENLELARVRASVGSAGPSEVYRWESEVAARRNDVIEANANRNLTEMNLNRILHRPLEESFRPERTEVDDPSMILRAAPPYHYIGNRTNFRLLRDYLSEEAIRLSPEIGSLDAAIDAQDRILRSRSLQYWIPDFALQGSVEKVFEQQGAGSVGADFSAVPTEFGWIGDLFAETPDDVNWQVGVSATLPLFRGGARYAAHDKARWETRRLRLARESAAEKIEQSIRSSLHLSGASFASIRLTREAAEAAGKTLRVVKDAYARGAASILDLLDAQNAALAAERAAAISGYRFLRDYMEVQRAVGRFDLLHTEGENREWLDALEAYFTEHGGTLPGTGGNPTD